MAGHSSLAKSVIPDQMGLTKKLEIDSCLRVRGLRTIATPHITLENLSKRICFNLVNICSNIGLASVSPVPKGAVAEPQFPE